MKTLRLYTPVLILFMLLSAFSARINATMTDSVTGNWQRAEDALHIWYIQADGNFKQVYNEETQVEGKWAVYSDTKDNGGKADPNGKFLWLSAKNGEVYCYEIEEASGTNLKIRNPSNKFEFSKMK